MKTSEFLVPEKPKPSAEFFSWGEDCANLHDGDCKLVEGCKKCSWSWPVDDPLTWKSKEAKCRCNNGHKSEFWYSGPMIEEPKKPKKKTLEAKDIEPIIVEEIEPEEEEPEKPVPPPFKGELMWGLDCESLTD